MNAPIERVPIAIPRRLRGPLVRAALGLALGWACVARADVRECIDDHSEGQRSRDESRFVEARERFVRCAMPSCPDAIRNECDELLDNLEQRMPTLVLAAQDEQGRDVAGVSVFLDGEPLDGALNGRSIPVDPGARRLRFVASDGRVERVEVVAREWVKGRRIQVRFASAKAAEPPAASPASTLAPPPAGASSSLAVTAMEPGDSADPRRTWGYVLGGVGVAALAGFGYFAVSGRSLKNELRESCAPRCSDAQASSVRSKYLVADVLLGVGLASVGTGTYLLLTSPGAEPAPLDQGLLIGVGGAF